MDELLTYQQMRQVAQDGDLIMVESRSTVGVLIRLLTAQQFSHVAMLVWIGDGLFVAEMREFSGYQLTPASQWVADTCAKDASIYYGQAPRNVRGCAHVRAVVERYRRERPRYSYLTLISVWLSQLFRRRMPGLLVCSTFVQRVWEKCGHTFAQLTDPGDYLRHAVNTTPLRCSHGR